MSNLTAGYKKIAIKFKHFRRELHAIWEAFVGIDYYMGTVHQLVKTDKLPPLKLPGLIDGSSRKLTKDQTYGVISHVRDKKNPRNALIDAISYFEHYIGFVVYTVYIDYPMILKNNIGEESTQRQNKLINIILDSDKKNQMIEKIVEDKIRSILYGNPADFFIKDKAKLQFKDFFKENHTDLVEMFVEINARRNIYIHNNGKVDSKYLREVPGSSYKKGQIAKFDKEYIKMTINTLETLAAIITVHVFENIYKVESRSLSIDRIYSRAKSK